MNGLDLGPTGPVVGAGQIFAMTFCGVMIFVAAVCMMTRRAQMRRVSRLMGEELKAEMEADDVDWADKMAMAQAARALQQAPSSKKTREVELVVGTGGGGVTSERM